MHPNTYVVTNLYSILNSFRLNTYNVLNWNILNNTYFKITSLQKEFYNIQYL